MFSSQTGQELPVGQPQSDRWAGVQEGWDVNDHWAGVGEGWDVGQESP